MSLKVKTARKPTSIYEEAWDLLYNHYKEYAGMVGSRVLYEPEMILCRMEYFLAEARQRREQTRLELRNKHNE